MIYVKNFIYSLCIFLLLCVNSVEAAPSPYQLSTPHVNQDTRLAKLKAQQERPGHTFRVVSREEYWNALDPKKHLALELLPSDDQNFNYYLSAIDPRVGYALNDNELIAGVIDNSGQNLLYEAMIDAISRSGKVYSTNNFSETSFLISLGFRSVEQNSDDNSIRYELEKTLSTKKEDVRYRYFRYLILNINDKGKSAQDEVYKSYPLIESLTIPKEHLLYHQKDLDVKRAGFLASNSYNWQYPVKQEKLDVFFGFFTNFNWDLAARHKVNEMAIGEIDENVVKGQEFIMKSIFTLADSPAEFLSILGCMLLKKETELTKVEEVFEQIQNDMQRIRKGDSDLTEERDGYYEFLISRIFDHPQLSIDQKVVLKNYLLDQLTNDTQKEDDRFVRSNSLFSKEYSEWAYSYNLFRLFFNRYHPNRFIKEKSASIQNHPYFSFLSSQEAYSHIRNLFLHDKVKYFISDIQNEELYQVVGNYYTEKSHKVEGINVGNIFDILQNTENRYYDELLVEFFNNIETHFGLDTALYYHHGLDANKQYERIFLDKSLMFFERYRLQGYQLKNNIANKVSQINIDDLTQIKALNNVGGEVEGLMIIGKRYQLLIFSPKSIELAFLEEKNGDIMMDYHKADIYQIQDAKHLTTLLIDVLKLEDSYPFITDFFRKHNIYSQMMEYKRLKNQLPEAMPHLAA